MPHKLCSRSVTLPWPHTLMEKAHVLERFSLLHVSQEHIVLIRLTFANATSCVAFLAKCLPRRFNYNGSTQSTSFIDSLTHKERSSYTSLIFNVGSIVQSASLFFLPGPFDPYSKAKRVKKGATFCQAFACKMQRKHASEERRNKGKKYLFVYSLYICMEKNHAHKQKKLWNKGTSKKKANTIYEWCQ